MTLGGPLFFIFIVLLSVLIVGMVMGLLDLWERRKLPYDWKEKP